MERWHVTITALQPISIASQISAQTEWKTTNFIPGSTWRGAIAEQWKYSVGFDHPQTETFISQCVFYDAHEKTTSFIPIYYKALKSVKTLADDVKQPSKINVLTHYLQTGEFLTVYNQRALMDSSPYGANIIETTSMGIQMSRTRESTEQGKLYTMTAIAEGTVFETTANIPEEILQLIAPQRELTVYIGKKRFSGYGKVRITFEKQAKASATKDEFLAWQHNQSTQNGQVTVVLTAKSPIILYDAFLRPATAINWQQHIQPLLSKHLQDLQPEEEQTWGLGGVRSGWNQVWNAPKPTEHVLLAGTTYIAIFNAEQEAVLDAILQIEQKGLGERIQEGFGQMIIAPTKLSKSQEKHNETKTFVRNGFTVEEEAEILLQAQQLVDQFMIDEKNKNIPTRQWQRFVNAVNPIQDITSVEKNAYLQYRINKGQDAFWGQKIGSEGKTTGEVLREAVNRLLNDEKYEGRQRAAVRLFLRFSARAVRMKKEEDLQNG